MPMSQSDDELRTVSGCKYEQRRRASGKLGRRQVAFPRSASSETGRPRLAAVRLLPQIALKECRRCPVDSRDSADSLQIQIQILNLNRRVCFVPNLAFQHD